MSVLCDLIEVSPDLLKLFIQYRELMTLYYRTSNCREEPNIGSIINISKADKEIIKRVVKLYPDRKQEIRQIWTLDNCRWVDSYQRMYSEEYIITKEYIPRIIRNGRSCNNLYLGRSWDLIGFLFGGKFRAKNSELVVWGKLCIGINVLSYQKNLLDSPCEYYLTVDEVKKLAQLIRDFADEIIAENLKELPDIYTSLYSYRNYRLDSSEYKDFVEESKALCDEVKKFYYKVAERENCIVIDIG